MQYQEQINPKSYIHRRFELDVTDKYIFFKWSSDVTRAVMGWKNVLYQSTKQRAELKLSRHLMQTSEVTLAVLLVNN